MKTTRFAAHAAAVIPLLFALLIIAGCGGGVGKISNPVTSPWHGDIDGVATEPADQETIFDTSRDTSWIHVFWPDFPSPASFTVTVEKEDMTGRWGGIHTRLSTKDSDAIGRSWWFQPDSDFSPDTSYRIIVSVQGEDPAVAYFYTAGTRAD